MKFHLYWLIAISTLLSAIVHSSSDTVAVGRNRLNNLQRKLKPWLKRRKPLPCWSCKLIVLELQNLFLSDSSERSVQKWLAFACEKFKVEDSAVCRGVASEFGAEVFYIVAKVVMNPPALCTLFGSSCNYSFGHDNWTIPFPNTTKPPVETLPDIPVGIPTLKVLHLTDIHFDPLYKQGADVDCSEPLCCRQVTGDSGRKAGKWGAPGKCDTPLVTLENLFQHLAKQKFDHIMVTGDIPPHNIWNQSRSDQLEIIRIVLNLLKTYFPTTPIYPAIGNHESAPVNSFPPNFVSLPQKFNISWLYDTLARDWPKLIVHNSSDSRIKKMASYEVEVVKGLKILSINSNYGNPENWWLAINDSDPEGILSWLVERLQLAEDNDEKVHIIAHIPNQLTRRDWSENYYSIVNRYESSIRAQFFGHTHFDTFTIFYEGNNSSGRPTSMAYVSPSVTPFAKVNPAYRIYYVDGLRPNSSFGVVDHETFVLDLETYKNSPKPQWKLEYNAKATYRLNNLWPKDWNDLIGRMTSHPAMLNHYNGRRLASRVPINCDEQCRVELLCDMRRGKSDSKGLC